jgi:uncharacterized membrane protein YfcA
LTIELQLLFFILLAAVAFLYASVGHGGASGYLALMALFNTSPDVMKPTALLLNVFVSLIAFAQFYRANHFKWKLFPPFAIGSIPLSFFGGTINIHDAVYKKILAGLLIFAVIRFIGFGRKASVHIKEPVIMLAVLIGGVIGLLSGMIGIGGGIILSPVLIFLKWADQKQAAAVSALFIFVNSVAGLSGQLSKGIAFSGNMYLYVIIALAGGIAGSYLGARKFKQEVLKGMLAVVLVIAIVKLLMT